MEPIWLKAPAQYTEAPSPPSAARPMVSSPPFVFYSNSAITTTKPYQTLPSPGGWTAAAFCNDSHTSLFPTRTAPNSLTTMWNTLFDNPSPLSQPLSNPIIYTATSMIMIPSNPYHYPTNSIDLLTDSQHDTFVRSITPQVDPHY